jgi:hypothetical protein
VVGTVVAELHLQGLGAGGQASSWWPRQMPKVGTLGQDFRMAAMA